jgi:septal ring factor EnvC (AmiA/AmiB activator)
VLSPVGFVQLWPEAPAKSAMTDAGALQAVKAELAALKASLDVAMRNDNSQLAKIADRLARVERTSNEPATKLARIAEAIDRLEKKSGAAAQATGAISAKRAGARH